MVSQNLVEWLGQAPILGYSIAGVVLGSALTASLLDILRELM